jgi:hypothetical protein
MGLVSCNGYDPDKTAHSISMADYDAFLLLQPYTNVEQINKKLNLDLFAVEKTGIERRDDIYVLCLLKDRKLDACYELPRSDFNFDGLKPTDTVYVRTGKLMLVKRDSVYYLQLQAKKSSNL